MAAGEDSETYDEEHAQTIDVTFDLHEIKIRDNKHLFICSYDKLFATGLIEHDFKSNEKAIELLKAGKLVFSHHKKEKKLFLKYGVQGLDLYITIGIPYNLFDLDVASCDEKEQLQYYKDKAMKLEKIIRMNHMVLKKYTVSKFNEKSVYTGFTLAEITKNPKMFYQQYKSASIQGFTKFSKGDPGQMEEYKRQDVFCVGQGWQFVTEDGNNYVYFNPRSANLPLLEVTKYDNEIVLNVRKLYLNQRAKQLYANKHHQQVLDEMCQDMVIGMIGDYDLMQTLESDPFQISLSFSNGTGSSYQVAIFYRFIIQSSGKLVMKHLYCVECVSFRPEESKPREEKVKKIQKPCISWIERVPPPKGVDTRTHYCGISQSSSWPGIQHHYSLTSLYGKWTLSAMTH